MWNRRLEIRGKSGETMIKSEKNQGLKGYKHLDYKWKQAQKKISDQNSKNISQQKFFKKASLGQLLAKTRKLVGHVGGSAGWASDFWSQLSSWPQGRGIESHVRFPNSSQSLLQMVSPPPSASHLPHVHYLPLSKIILKTSRVLGTLWLLGGTHNGAAAVGDRGWCLKELSAELIHDPAMPLLGIYPEGPTAGSWKYTYTRVQGTALVTTA